MLLVRVFNVQKGRAKKTEDIDVGTLGKDESEKILKILDVATEHGCPKVRLDSHPFDLSLQFLFEVSWF